MATHLPVDGVGSDGALALLEAGIPLSLLLDLAMPIQSADLYRAEPADADWIAQSRVA